MRRPNTSKPQRHRHMRRVRLADNISDALERNVPAERMVHELRQASETDRHSELWPGA